MSLSLLSQVVRKVWSLSQREALPPVYFINMTLRNDPSKDQSGFYSLKKLWHTEPFKSYGK